MFKMSLRTRSRFSAGIDAHFLTTAALESKTAALPDAVLPDCNALFKPLNLTWQPYRRIRLHVDVKTAGECST